MSLITRLVLASNNAGKLREFRRLLEPLGYAVIPQAELGVAAADEPHVTFIENALAKARQASLHTGLPALADDSGICVDALGGAPGVLSARYAGEPASDARNNAALVAALAGVADRRAHYYCVLVFVRRADDPQPIFAEGIWKQGRIVQRGGRVGAGPGPCVKPVIGRVARGHCRHQGQPGADNSRHGADGSAGPRILHQRGEKPLRQLE